MCLYVLSSVLLISLVFFVLSCYVSLCSEFRVAHFFSFFVCCPVMCLYVLSSVLLISLVFLCCPVICLYVLSSVLLISLGFFVLSCYVALCFPCCDVRYDFRIKTMLCSSLPPAVCSRVHVLFTLFVFV